MHRTMIAKMGGEILGATVSAVGGILAAGESAAITTSAIVAVLGFAGLLVRQVMTGQRAIWQIVAAKDREIQDEKDANHYLRWEMERLRYLYGERQVDPGPYTPRRPNVAPAQGA